MTKEVLSKRLAKLLNAPADATRWERLIGQLIERLELSPSERADAEGAYADLGRQIARQLDLPGDNVRVFPQGSMRTQTTICPRGNQKFDLDIVVELSGSAYKDTDSESFFSSFGAALEECGADTGDPEAKRRCWRLPYPNKPYYFDVTPALPDPRRETGAALKVRDPETRWAPSNPDEFADWFCDRANRRFPFQLEARTDAFVGRSTIEPLPSDKVGLNDILRRAVQLMKLHRDNMYWNEPDAIKEAKPISVIVVTLAARAFEHLWSAKRNQFSSPIEVVLAVVENLAQHVEHRGSLTWVANPALESENFADRWNTDDGARKRQFLRWLTRLQDDIADLLTEDPSTVDERKLRSVFGQAGVEAWKASLPKPSVLQGLVASAAPHVSTNPTSPIRTGSKATLA